MEDTVVIHYVIRNFFARDKAPKVVSGHFSFDVSKGWENSNLYLAMVTEVWSKLNLLKMQGELRVTLVIDFEPSYMATEGSYSDRVFSSYDRFSEAVDVTLGRILRHQEVPNLVLSKSKN